MWKPIKFCTHFKKIKNLTPHLPLKYPLSHGTLWRCGATRTPKKNLPPQAFLHRNAIFVLFLCFIYYRWQKTSTPFSYLWMFDLWSLLSMIWYVHFPYLPFFQIRINIPYLTSDIWFGHTINRTLFYFFNKRLFHLIHFAQFQTNAITSVTRFFCKNIWRKLSLEGF